MGFIALITWFITVLAGLYMLAVWLIENDATRQASSDSRLPLPVIVTHMTLAVSGLAVWAAYLLLDRPVLAWTAVGLLGCIVLLGSAMFARWIPVYRTTGAATAARPVPVSSGGIFEPSPVARPVAIDPEEPGKPPEGNFPLVVVIGHGICATATVVLVLLTALGVGVGGS